MTDFGSRTSIVIVRIAVAAPPSPAPSDHITDVSAASCHHMRIHGSTTESANERERIEALRQDTSKMRLCRLENLATNSLCAWKLNPIVESKHAANLFRKRYVTQATAISNLGKSRVSALPMRILILKKIKRYAPTSPVKMQRGPPRNHVPRA